MNEPMALTEAQRSLVEHYLTVVDWVIRDHIKLNPQVCGLDYSDVYQEGCVHLCRAAVAYTGEPAGFGAYARKVVRNGLISYCRQICRREPDLPLLDSIPEPEPPADHGSPSLEEQVLNKLAGENLVRTLHQVHAQSSGVVRLGLEAMDLKVKGMTGQEIAALYGVKPNQHESALVIMTVIVLHQGVGRSMVAIESLPVLSTVCIVCLIVLNHGVGSFKGPNTHIIAGVLIAAVFRQIVLDQGAVGVTCGNTVTADLFHVVVPHHHIRGGVPVERDVRAVGEPLVAPGRIDELNARTVHIDKRAALNQNVVIFGGDAA